MGYGAIQRNNSPVRAHVTDADTIAHWKFDGDFTDSGPSGIDLTTGTYEPHFIDPVGGLRCYSHGANDCYVTDSSLLITGALSMAGLVYLSEDPNAYIPFFGLGPIVGGSGAANNYLGVLQTNPSGNLDYFHNSGTKVPQSFPTSLSFPLNTWCWIGFTRNSAGTGVTVFLNDQTDTLTLGAAPSNGTNCEFLIGTQANSNKMNAFFSSVIVKDIEVADLNAWRAETNFDYRIT